MQVLKKHLQNPSLANENKHFASSSFLLPQNFQILICQKAIQPTHFLYLKVPGSQDQLVITYLQMGHIIDVVTYNPQILTFYILFTNFLGHPRSAGYLTNHIDLGSYTPTTQVSSPNPKAKPFIFSVTVNC